MLHYLSAALTNTFYHSVDLLGCIDYSELGALADVKKEIVKLIISAGFVDLSEGSATKTKLDSFFPEGTETHTAIVALIESHRSIWTGEQT